MSQPQVSVGCDERTKDSLARQDVGAGRLKERVPCCERGALQSARLHVRHVARRLDESLLYVAACGGQRAVSGLGKQDSPPGPRGSTPAGRRRSHHRAPSPENSPRLAGGSILLKRSESRGRKPGPSPLSAAGLVRGQVRTHLDALDRLANCHNNTCCISTRHNTSLEVDRSLHSTAGHLSSACLSAHRRHAQGRRQSRLGSLAPPSRRP